MKAVFPINYDLEFEPDFDKFKFKGRERITIQARTTRQIILNSAELDIKDCQIVVNKKTLRPKIRLDAKNEELILSLPEKVSGKAVLLIDFEGVLMTNLLDFTEVNTNMRVKKNFLPLPNLKQQMQDALFHVGMSQTPRLLLMSPSL